MARYTKEQALKEIVNCAAKYERNLLNRSLLFIAADNNGKTTIAFEVCFFDRNFLHLTGVTVDRKIISASSFFKRCIDHRLSAEDFIVPDNGLVDLKLSVLPSLLNKNLSANSVGDFNGNGVNLYTEKLVGNVKACMGFALDCNSNLLTPNTVLNEDIRRCTHAPQHRILITYRKNLTDERYSEIVYSAKNVKFESLVLPVRYSYLPKPVR